MDLVDGVNKKTYSLPEKAPDGKTILLFLKGCGETSFHEKEVSPNNLILDSNG